MFCYLSYFNSKFFCSQISILRSDVAVKKEKQELAANKIKLFNKSELVDVNTSTVWKQLDLVLRH